MPSEACVCQQQVIRLSCSSQFSLRDRLGTIKTDSVSAAWSAEAAFRALSCNSLTKRPDKPEVESLAEFNSLGSLNGTALRSSQRYDERMIR